MRSVAVALAAGLTALVLAIGVTMLHSPMSVARTNGVATEEHRIDMTRHDASYCQANELLPQGTSALRLSFSALTGPRIHVVVTAGGRQTTSGERSSAWTSRVVTVPVKPLPRTVANVTVCASFRLKDESVTVFGEPTPPASAARDGRRHLMGRFFIEYLRPGRRSWASLASSTVAHMGLGRAAAGAGIVLLAIALLVAIAAIASRLVLEELP
jgi:hypothetical protein